MRSKQRFLASDQGFDPRLTAILSFGRDVVSSWCP